MEIMKPNLDGITECNTIKGDKKSAKKEGVAFPHPEKRHLGIFSIYWLGRIESC